MQNIAIGEYRLFITDFVTMIDEHVQSNSENETLKKYFQDNLHDLIRRKLKELKKELEKCKLKEEEEIMEQIVIVADIMVVREGWEYVQMMLGVKPCVCCGNSQNTKAEEPSQKRRKMHGDEKQKK